MHDVTSFENKNFHPEFVEQIQYFAGIKLDWRGATNINALGTINIMPISNIVNNWNLTFDFWDEEEHGARILDHFHIVDYYGEDRGVGIFSGPYASRSLYFYDFSFSDYPIYLGINLESYIKLSIVCKGIRDWAIALVQANFNSSVYMSSLKDNMPSLFSSFDLEATLNLYKSLYFSEKIVTAFEDDLDD